MKRNFYALGLMLAATFTLTNCTKEFENPSAEPEGVPFEIVASTVDTKTANDGMSTKWVADDAINLFHAVTDGTAYTNDKAFKVNDVEAGTFTGTLTGTLDVDEEYDWYAFYPYTSQITTPANKDTYVTVASKASGAQTQNGNNSMAHVAGANYPMVGKAYATPAGSTPELKMSHVTSLIEVVVTNKTEEPLTVTEVIFNAPELLVGTFYVNFAGEITPASFVSSGDSYTSKTAKLAVNNGEAIAKGASAKFYLAVKPFEAEAGDILELYVNGSVKELELSNSVSFAAGKIKTLNYAYEVKASGPEAVTVAEFLDKEVNAAVWYQLTGVVSNIANTQYGNFDLVDETGSVYVYGLTQTKQPSNDQTFKNIGLKEGDVLTLIGTRAVHGTTVEVGGPAYYISHVVSCMTPVISFDEDTYTVSIDAEDGAKIYYTTDESDPTEASLAYDKPFEIEETTIVKAIAVADGKAKSVVASRTCVISSGEPVTVLYESFDKCKSTGGNDGQWGGSIASGAFSSDLKWTVEKAYAGSKCAKFGTKSALGTAETPELGTAGNMTLTFKAGAWSGDKTTLKLSVSGGGTLSKSTVTLKSEAWSDYTVTITGATAATKIKFSGNDSSKCRFFLDEVKIVKN